jgi:hypothetical protein
MRFMLYTERSVAECVKALSERIAQSPTATRPALDGYADKTGRFAVALTTEVFAKFTRKTWLEGTLARESGATVIRGAVPDGAPPKRQRLIAYAIPVVGVFLALNAAWLLAAAAVILMTVVWVTLKGDYENGDRLLLEIERLLKASPRPPKKPAPAGKK